MNRTVALSYAEIKGLLDGNPDLFGTDETDPVYQSAFLVLAGVGRPKHANQLHRFSKFDTARVKSVMKNLKNAGIWSKEDRLTFADLSGDAGVLTLIMTAMVGAGLVQQVG